MSETTNKEEEKPLKPEWIVFCHEYVKHWHQTDSYMVAYPKSSKEAASSSSCELLRNPRIAAYVEAIQEDMQKLAGISMLSNLTHLKEIMEKDDETTRDKISALKVINDMLGLNAPVKKDIRVDDNRISPEEREKRIKALQDKAKKDSE